MVKVCGDAFPRMTRCGSPTPAITVLTSECTGLIEATTCRPSSADAGFAAAQPSSASAASAPGTRRGIVDGQSMVVPSQAERDHKEDVITLRLYTSLCAPCNGPTGRSRRQA